MPVRLKTNFLKALCRWLPAASSLPQAFKDWLIEYSFSRLLGSAWADYVIQHTHYFVVSSLLLELRALEDFFGLAKVVLPVLVYAGLHLVCAFIKHLKKCACRNNLVVPQ